MNSRYQTLRTIYDITATDPQPTTYLCKPREIILRQLSDWDLIKINIAELEKEELVITKQLDTLVISITAAGIEKIRTMIKDTEAA
jgi:hypothetical protein